MRILNALDKVQTISAQTVVPVAKPLTSVVELEVLKQTSDIPKIAVRKIHEGGDESGETLPDPLNELWQRSSEQLTEEESQAVGAEVLHRHKGVFSLSWQDKPDKTPHCYGKRGTYQTASPPHLTGKQCRNREAS